MILEQVRLSPPLRNTYSGDETLESEQLIRKATKVAS